MYTNDGSIEAVATVAIGMVMLIIVLLVALGILIIVSKWKILKKGGKNGWEALIPYYGDWVICEMVGVCPYWVLIMLAGSIISSSVEGARTATNASVESFGIVSVLVLIVSIYYYIILNVSLAKSFGKDPAYAIGLILLPGIFYPMLGLGKSEYVGANPMKDVILGSLNKNNGTNQQNTNINQPVNPQVQNINPQSMNNQPASFPGPTATQQNAFCTNCGAPLTADSTFCTNCGTKVN